MDMYESFARSRQGVQANNSPAARAVSDFSEIDFDYNYMVEKDIKPINLRRELSEDELIEDEGWNRASQTLYESYMGNRNLKGRNKARGASVPSTPQEYGAWGVEFIGQMNHNFTSMAVNVNRLRDMDNDTKFAMHHLFNEYERLPEFSWGGTQRFFKGVLTDPTTYVGLGTLGLATVGRAGAQQMSKSAFRSLLRGSLDPRLLAAYEGAGYVGADDAMRQSIDVQAGVQQELDLGQTLEAAAIGAVGGGGLAQLGKTVADNAPAIAGAIREGVSEMGAAADERIAQRAQDTSVTLSAGVDPMPAIDAALSAAGRSVRPDTTELKTVLEARANEMAKPPAQRLQPQMTEPLFNLELTPGMNDNPYLRVTSEQKDIPVPRAPEGAKLPMRNRGAGVVEKSDQIASVLADRAKPFVGSNVQYFYHTGPVIEKAVELGIPEETARAQLRKFAENYAATSPRTQTEPNLRNASLVSAKQQAGISLEEIIGPGGSGINEKGYPMMIGPGGIHQKLVDDAAAGGFNFNTNPKPATFVENVAGNHSGVTADTHAIRAVFDAMNEIEPGSVPIDFIGGKTAAKTKEFQKMYQDDPSSLDVATMINDTLKSQKVNGESVQTEYAIFSDIYKAVAEKLGVQPAEAQSLSWFANGSKTGLGSEPKTIAQLIDERVDVTAQALGQSKAEVFKKFMQGSIPLMSVGGMTLLDTGAAQSVMAQDDETAVANDI
jgi:hypothetical protein